ncbi:MAG TPA: asparagine synthase (glutamine-hydrolyzing) [Methylomirabilota bacterium]|nr:asparagine synthase (glutamine-hydrolyzing) [Methylomirabilota bacterium]
MCGIAGLFRRHGRDRSDAERLCAMTESLVHRGPDDHGYLVLDSRDGRFSLGSEAPAGAEGDVLLGARRLSILDLSSAGRQPLTNETRDIFLTFNGEIYNYVELRAELRGRGHHFASRSDAEVVVHAYEEWGPECVRRFNGMWAFALWDQPRRRLLCSRDRFGAKPFYYRLNGGLFVFGSEIKAILAALHERPSPHWPTILAYLTAGAVCHTVDTFFDGIERLPAAHNLLVSRDRVELVRYWDYQDQSHAYDYRRPAATFAGLFDDAVRLRLRADVPVGLTLSGGVDSASVTAVARRHLPGAPLKAFTAEFPGKPYDERRYAELVARRFDAELYTVAYQPISLVEDLRRVIWYMDYPTPHSQILARWRLMSLAAQHVKVVLEGQGSDEMLAGYPFRYFNHHAAHELRMLGHRGFVRRCGRLIAAGTRMSYRLGGEAIALAASRVLPAVNRLRGSIRLREDVISRELRGLIPGPPGPSAGPQGPFADGVAKALHADHARDMLPQLLKLGDAISMAHSVEARMPFLDYRLVEFAFRLPVQEKFDGVTTKIILRRALGDALPPEIVGRTDKIGFMTPIEEWLAGALDREIRPLLLSPEARRRGVFEPATLARALDRLPRGGRSLALLIYRWLAVEVWFRLFIDAPAPGGARPLPPLVATR